MTSNRGGPMFTMATHLHRSAGRFSATHGAGSVTYLQGRPNYLAVSSFQILEDPQTARALQARRWWMAHVHWQGGCGGLQGLNAERKISEDSGEWLVTRTVSPITTLVQVAHVRGVLELVNK